MLVTEDNETYIIVGRSSSKCGKCRRGCNPTALAHDTIIEYGPETGQPGCGAKFLYCINTYINTDQLHGMIAADMEGRSRHDR